MLSSLLQYKRNVDNSIRVFMEKSTYLKPGYYALGTNYKYFFRLDSVTKRYMKEFIFNNNRNLKTRVSLKNILKWLLIPKIIKIPLDTNNVFFNGTVYLPANDLGFEKDIKLFDFEKARIMTIYASKKKLNDKIDNYAYFNKWFNIPTIYMYDYDHAWCIEKLIYSKPKKKWNKHDHHVVVKRIMQNYVNYYSSASDLGFVTYKSIEKMFHNLKEKHYYHELTNLIEKNLPIELIEEDIPVVKQHGDLWLYNTLLVKADTDSVYFIDWEHSGEYFALYDLFWWMQNEAVYNNDYSYLEKYLFGGYDYYFKKIFEFMDMEYKKNWRAGYFNLFVIEMLYKRFINNTYCLNNIINELYMPLIEKVNEINKRIINIRP